LLPPYFRNIIRERQKNNMKRCLPAEPRRIIGKRVQSPCGPAAVTEESYQISHWETGKAWYDNDTGARRPALHKGSMLRMFPASVTSDDRVRKAGLLRAENTDLHFIPVFVCIYAAKSGIFLTGGKHSFPLCPLSLCLHPCPVGPFDSAAGFGHAEVLRGDAFARINTQRY